MPKLIAHLRRSNSSLSPAQFGEEVDGEDKVVDSSPIDKLPNELVVSILSLALPTRSPGTLDTLLLCKRFYDLGHADWLSRWAMSTGPDGSNTSLLELIRRPAFHCRFTFTHTSPEISMALVDTAALYCKHSELSAYLIEDGHISLGKKCLFRVGEYDSFRSYTDTLNKDSKLVGKNGEKEMYSFETTFHRYIVDPVFEQDSLSDQEKGVRLLKAAATSSVETFHLQILSTTDVPLGLPSVSSIVLLHLELDGTDLTDEPAVNSLRRLLTALPSLNTLRVKGGSFSKSISATERLSLTPSSIRFLAGHPALSTLLLVLRLSSVTRFYSRLEPEEYRWERSNCDVDFDVDRWRKR